MKKLNPMTIAAVLLASFNKALPVTGCTQAITATEAKAARPAKGYKSMISECGGIHYTPLAELVTYIEAMLSIRDLRVPRSTRYVLLNHMAEDLCCRIDVHELRLLTDNGTITLCVYGDEDLHNTHMVSDGQSRIIHDAFTAGHVELGFPAALLVCANTAMKMVSPKLASVRLEELPEMDYCMIVKAEGNKHKLHLRNVAIYLERVFEVRGRQMRREVMLRVLDYFCSEYCQLTDAVELVLWTPEECIVAFREQRDKHGFPDDIVGWDESFNELIKSHFKSSQVQAVDKHVAQTLHQINGGHLHNAA